jgi:hypothetical protein
MLSPVTAPHPGNREYRNETVRIAELTVVTDMLDNLRFENCQIIGPAVLVLLDHITMSNCSFDAPDPNSMFWIIPPDRPGVVGAVGVVNCEFFSCQFQRVGFAGPVELKARFEGANEPN